YRAGALGRTIRYVLDYDYADAPGAFSWTLVEGDMVKAIDGRYRFTANDEGTSVTYDLRVDLAVPMPGLVKRRAAALITRAALRCGPGGPRGTPGDTAPFSPPPGTPPPAGVSIPAGAAPRVGRLRDRGDRAP